ncbi:MAG: GntR family transcriptional regulator [Actinomycetaceae bacterium]|nr:GntR family transcriptional regulator [Actinomycetaceae bacterium]
MAQATCKGISKSERVYRNLHEGILSGLYPAGHRLVLDRIARELGVSAVPVREAVRRLEAEGLVKFQRNVGAIVSGVDKQSYAVTVEALAVIEAYATALSAPLLSERDIAQARALNEKMRAMLPGSFDSREFAILNVDFHRALAKRCPNNRLIELMERECERITIIRCSSSLFDASDLKRAVEEHSRILQVIEEGSAPREIETLIRDHELGAVATT